VSHHRPAYGQRNKADKNLLNTRAADHQEQSNSTKGQTNNKDQYTEGKMSIVNIWKTMNIFERIMAILTFAGVVIAIFTGLIFWKQLDEMKTDERAWLNISSGIVQFPKDISSVSTVPVSVPMTINNIGKTAARTIRSEFVMDYEVNGQSPDFVYDGRVRTYSTTGIMFPNAPQPVEVAFAKAQLGNPNGPAESRYLTPSEYQDLSNGNAYMAIYARATFADIFGTQHWLRYCTFFAAPNAKAIVTARQCTDYNDTDHD